MTYFATVLFALPNTTYRRFRRAQPIFITTCILSFAGDEDLNENERTHPLCYFSNVKIVRVTHEDAIVKSDIPKIIDIHAGPVTVSLLSSKIMMVPF